MTGEPLFSVVVPAYNYGHLLPRTLASVFRQRGPDFEVILVDDGSTDDTPRVMAGLAETADGERLRYLRQDNQGPAAARAAGLAAARGHWLVFLDADDELLDGALATFAAAIAEHPGVDLVVAAHVSHHDGLERVVPPGPVGPDREANFQGYLDKRIHLSNGACALHRPVFETLPWRRELGHTEDMPAFAHLMACYTACRTEQPVLRVHHHAGSRRNDLDAALAVGMDLEAAIFDNNGLPDWARAHRRRYRARRALSLMKMAHRRGRRDLVRRYFRIALAAHWREALRPRYLRRFLGAFRSGAG